MIELFEEQLHTVNRQSSKGNQLKWTDGCFWYKADYTGYEGLAEYTVSQLLKKSSLKPAEFVLYEPEQIRYRSVVFRGAKSADFKREDWQIITLERLFQQFFGEGLNRLVWNISDHKERLQFLVDQTIRITGLSDFGVYMNKLLTIDALFLNEDRHSHNIAVLMNGRQQFDYCPIFDNGASLLADTSMDYPLGIEPDQLIPNVKAKTFCTDFDEQLDISEELYGRHLYFTFTRSDVESVIDSAEEYLPAEKDRVRDLIFHQMRKYDYLMKNE